MSNKTYNQYCAIANALDQVGDRWTLIIVRNLLFGPKRFSDLLQAAPTISTNILTERLKQLEANQIIGTRFLPPPAASHVYYLTASGYGLIDVLSALARWGSLTLGTPDNRFIVNEGIAFMVMGMFQRPTPPPIIQYCAVEVDDALYRHTFGFELAATGVNPRDQAEDSPTVVLKVRLEPLLKLSSGRISLRQALEQGEVILEGDSETVDHLIRWVDRER